MQMTSTKMALILGTVCVASFMLCACNRAETLTISETTSVAESSEPLTTSTPAPAATPTPTSTSAPSPTPTEETVYIYGGRYHHAGDPAIEGKTVESMTLSDAQNAGYTDGATMTEDEKTAYDYNMAWDMVAQGKSDGEIRTALVSTGYSNEDAANFMIRWVREDFASGHREYEPSETSSSNGDSSSSGSSSGSGSAESSGGSSSSAPTQPAETQVPASTETDAPTLEETQAPAPAEIQSDWQSGFEDVYGPQPTPTEPHTPTPSPVPATPTPVPATPTPTPVPTFCYYELNCLAWDEDGYEHPNTFTGSSLNDVENQYLTWCGEHNYDAGSYNVYAVYSDGSKKPA